MACSGGIGEDCPQLKSQVLEFMANQNNHVFMVVPDGGSCTRVILVILSHLHTCHAWKAERQGAFTVLFVDLAPAKHGFCDGQHVDMLQG